MSEKPPRLPEVTAGRLNRSWHIFCWQRAGTCRLVLMIGADSGRNLSAILQ